MNITSEQYGALCALFEAAWHHEVPDSLRDLVPMTSPDARKLSNLALEALGLEVEMPSFTPEQLRNLADYAEGNNPVTPR